MIEIKKHKEWHRKFFIPTHKISEFRLASKDFRFDLLCQLSWLRQKIINSSLQARQHDERPLTVLVCLVDESNTVILRDYEWEEIFFKRKILMTMIRWCGTKILRHKGGNLQIFVGQNKIQIYNFFMRKKIKSRIDFVWNFFLRFHPLKLF